LARTGGNAHWKAFSNAKGAKGPQRIDEKRQHEKAVKQETTETTEKGLRAAMAFPLSSQLAPV
jgi:hypothetical protein